MDSINFVAANTTEPTWGELFYAISPYSWCYVGVAIALTWSIMGAAW